MAIESSILPLSLRRIVLDAQSRRGVSAGYTQTMRTLQRRHPQLALIAADTDDQMRAEVERICDRAGVYYAYVASRRELGELLGCRRPTACGAVEVTEPRLLGGILDTSSPGETAKGAVQRIDMTLWFRACHFEPMLRGDKHGTLRVGRRIPRELILPVVETESRMFRGSVQIEQTSWLRWSDVSGRSDVLRQEWPNTWVALEQAMIETYGELDPKVWMTFYGFVYLRDE